METSVFSLTGGIVGRILRNTQKCMGTQSIDMNRYATFGASLVQQTGPLEGEVAFWASLARQPHSYIPPPDHYRTSFEEANIPVPSSPKTASLGQVGLAFRVTTNNQNTGNEIAWFKKMFFSKEWQPVTGSCHVAHPLLYITRGRTALLA